MKKWLLFVFILLPASAFSWNALGHRLVAQIAYDQMNSHAKSTFKRYNQALDRVYKPQSWVDSAVWLDTLRYQDINWFAAMHYIDIPFSDDGSQLFPPQDINAVWAIEKSTRLLSNQYATDFDKGIALRILLHVVGDLHQPLHAITKISKEHPLGDRGGNLVALPGNSVAKNLHTYWDKGAGLLVDKKHRGEFQIKKRAMMIEQRWPCKLFALETKATQWANESHALAVKKAYKLPISKQYQNSAKKISEKRIALAGCRLGTMLNRIDDKSTAAPRRHTAIK